MKYFSLSPSTDLESPVYFEALDEKLNDDSIKNIAITGTYGSGKSSILESYIVNDTKNRDNYLKVSLANFCELNDNLTPEDEKKIEEHILQQLFYQLSHNSIPFSGFKQLSHFNTKSLQKSIVFTIIWLFSLALMPKVIKLLNANLQTITTEDFNELWSQIYWLGTVLNIAVLVVFCIGLFYIIKELIRVKQKGQLKKVAMKSAQIELSEDSILNKHIDELIYFFEATDKSIVIIEDLDRFNSVVLFSKLREVNFIINNSPKVKPVVKFVYAIRDEIFKDNLNRTKFFDFILPIVPVINTTNSGDKLRGFLQNDPAISKSFINEISLYIHDLRLLKNIVNEYLIYNRVINENNKKRGVFLFSIILYKNLFPKDFGLEHSEKGLLYKIFKERKIALQNEFTLSGKTQIAMLEEQKSVIVSATAQNEEKLREEYIFEILKTHLNVVSICGFSIKDISSESIKFNKLLDTPQIKVFRPNNGRTDNHGINFDDIQNKVNSNYSYTERLELLGENKNKKYRELNQEITKNKKEISLFKRKKLSELIKQFEDSNWKKVVFNIDNDKLSTEEELLALLIRKGYIDENYQLYMSHFYVGALSLGDFEYLLNIKNNEGDNFDTKLSNVTDLISRITEDEYEYKATLNKDLIKNLIKRTGYKEDKRLELLFDQFKFLDDAFENYILPLIDDLCDSPVGLKRFIELMIEKYYPTIWDDYTEEYSDSNSIDNFIKLFLFLSEENIKKLNNASRDSLREYLVKKDDFIDVFTSYNNPTDITKLIRALDLKFQNIDLKDYGDDLIFDYIYKHDSYEINKSMLHLMLINKYSINEIEFEEIFYKKNYTCIIESHQDNLNNYISEEFNAYINDVYLQLDEKQKESEEAIISFIEVLEDDADILQSVLERTSTKIEDLEKFGHNEKWDLLFDGNNVSPNWKNLIYYFKENEKTIDKTIINWLNRNDIYENITKIQLSNDYDVYGTEGISSSLRTQITESDRWIGEAYKRFVICFPYRFDNLNIDSISVGKIAMLIEYYRLIFNVHHYEQLVNLELNDLLLDFTINNIVEFTKDYQDYSFSLELHWKLLESNKLDLLDKKVLLKSISSDNIDNSRLATSIGNFLLKLKTPLINKSKIIQVIRKCNNQELQLKLFYKFIENFDFTEIDIILENIGGVYKQASQLRKRPTWKKNKLNLSISNKLREIGYFRSVDTGDKDEMKIVVRYS